ncbi:MAG: DNA cytosine methyltransferase [Gammaproteobacteria bacterium]|nr:DNA cytosine methyltransferase [Gammaproteobacteria bacterium]
MPERESRGLAALSLFSGGGGLDYGFERAGFAHVASFDVLDVCGETLRANRPSWTVFSGSSGDVSTTEFAGFAGSVDVVHGGPPCQPFSVAGKQSGGCDRRDMWPSFIRAIRTIRPAAFVAENVPGLLGRRFDNYVEETIVGPLSQHYNITSFRLSASAFGVPQERRRVFFVGFKSAAAALRYTVPAATHGDQGELFSVRSRTLGARAALGLDGTGFDCFAPTLRSGFTGPRKTTSILNSKASQRVWEQLRIWPNGVQDSREAAIRFPPENGHFRLAVQDCGLLQGFPEDWRFAGAVYQVIGQIGNSVCPPVAYAVANSIADAIRG